jgi:hypothetical protein
VAVYKRKDRDTWVARLSGPDGRLVQKNFARKTDAVRWHADQLAARERGDFIDPRDGKATLARFYEQWAARQVWEKGTERAMSLALRSCSFAEVPLSRIRRSHVEAWVKTMAGDLAPSTVKTPRVSQFWLIMFRLPPRLRERLGFLAGWPAQGMGREIWRR